MPIIRICLTGDLHGHFPIALQRAIKKARETAPNPEGFILLDAGDAITASNITWNMLPEPILGKMSHAGYDAMVCGNREFHYSRSGLQAKHRGASFPILASNVLPIKRNTNPVVAPFTVLERMGVRFGIMGLMEEMITEKMLDRNPLLRAVSAWMVTPAVETAADMIPVIRPKCDIMVALTHIGTADDRAVAQLGVDLVLGGHDHTMSSEPIEVGSSYILHTGKYGQHLGILDYDTDRLEIVSWSCRRVKDTEL